MIYSALNSIQLFVQPEILPYIPNYLNLKFELLQIVLLSFAIPIVTFLGLLFKYKLK